VKKTQDEIIQNETKYHLLQMQIEVQELWLKRCQEELKTYVSSSKKASAGSGEPEKKKSVRDQLLRQIAEQEKRGKALKEEQKKVKDSLAASSKQVHMWGNLERLLACKKKCAEDALEAADGADADIRREQGAETLVL